MGVTHSYSSRLFLCALEWGLRLNYIYPHAHNAVHFQLRIVFCVLAAVCCILCMGGAQLNLHYVLFDIHSGKLCLNSTATSKMESSFGAN